MPDTTRYDPTNARWAEIDEQTAKLGWPRMLQATYQKTGSYLVYVEGVPSPLSIERSDPEASAPGWVRLRTSSGLCEEIDIRLERIIAVGVPPSEDPLTDIPVDPTLYHSYDPFGTEANAGDAT